MKNKTMGVVDDSAVMRQLPDCAHVPILVLSTASGDTSKAEARKAGASRHATTNH